MAEKILPVILKEGDNARVESIAGGNHLIRLYSAVLDQNGRVRPNPIDRGAFGEDGVGKGVPLILDDDTTLVVKSAPRPNVKFAHGPYKITGGDPTIKLDSSELSPGDISVTNLSRAAASLQIVSSGPVHVNINDAMTGPNTREVNVNGGPLVVRMLAETLQESEITVSGSRTEIAINGRTLISKGPVLIDIVTADNKTVYRGSAEDFAGHSDKTHEKRTAAVLAAANSGKPAKLTIPANLDINGFKPRIRFDDSVLMEDGSFIVDAGSKARPRIDISHVISLGEDKNTHAWRLTTKTGSITRTYVIEKGAAGIELQAPGQDKPIVIERNRSLAETQKRLAPLAPPKKEPQQEMPRQPAVPAENRDAVRKELAVMNEKINTLGERVRQWSAYEHLGDVFAPVKKASYRFSSKDNPDTAAFGEVLDTAIGKLEKLVQEKEQSGKRDAPAEDMIKKLQDVKKDMQHIHDLRAPGGKTGMLPKPLGMSEKQLTEAVKAVTLPTGSGSFVIHTKPAATLSPIPNLGAPARTV